MERRRTVVSLMLVAVVMAGLGLPAVTATGGTFFAQIALLAAGLVGFLTLRNAEREEAASVAARRARKELLANVSHELRTPLNAILGYAEILESMPDLPHEEHDRMVARILSNTVTLTCSVNNLLEYSAFLGGEEGVRFTPVPLGDLFDELEPWVARMVDGKPIAFDWTVEDELPPIETDRAKLRQVLLNLLANAAKFTDDGRIALSARRVARGSACGIEIAISDTGVGMTAVEQARIFDDFGLREGKYGRPLRGIGLGLSLVRRLAALLGGSLALESAPGRGTTFTLSFPEWRSATSACHSRRDQSDRRRRSSTRVARRVDTPVTVATVLPC